jgi:hypothetical protein
MNIAAKLRKEKVKVEFSDPRTFTMVLPDYIGKVYSVALSNSLRKVTVQAYKEKTYCSEYSISINILLKITEAILRFCYRIVAVFLFYT